MEGQQRLAMPSGRSSLTSSSDSDDKSTPGEGVGAVGDGERDGCLGEATQRAGVRQDGVAPFGGLSSDQEGGSAVGRGSCASARGLYCGCGSDRDTAVNRRRDLEIGEPGPQAGRPRASPAEKTFPQLLRNLHIFLGERTPFSTVRAPPSSMRGKKIETPFLSLLRLAITHAAKV